MLELLRLPSEPRQESPPCGTMTSRFLRHGENACTPPRDRLMVGGPSTPHELRFSRTSCSAQDDKVAGMDQIHTLASTFQFCHSLRLV